MTLIYHVSGIDCKHQRITYYCTLIVRYCSGKECDGLAANLSPTRDVMLTLMSKAKPGSRTCVESAIGYLCSVSLENDRRRSFLFFFIVKFESGHTCKIPPHTNEKLELFKILQNVKRKKSLSVKKL